MGQLEAYNINETILSSIIAIISNNYISESQESNTFESYKSIIYSINIIYTKKNKKNNGVFKVLPVITPNNGVFKSWYFINFINKTNIITTKLVDDINIWQDQTLMDSKIDESIVRLQRKYNLI